MKEDIKRAEVLRDWPACPLVTPQRYRLCVVDHVGGHYGEEQWTTTEMLPDDQGDWVKYHPNSK